MNEYGDYTPVKNDRITVTRTPGNHAKIGVMTGTVLDIVPLPGIGDVMDFRADNGGGRAYLATNAQMAEMGKIQTVEREA